MSKVFMMLSNMKHNSESHGGRVAQSRFSEARVKIHTQEILVCSKKQHGWGAEVPEVLLVFLKTLIVSLTQILCFCFLNISI